MNRYVLFGSGGSVLAVSSAGLGAGVCMACHPDGSLKEKKWKDEKFKLEEEKKEAETAKNNFHRQLEDEREKVQNREDKLLAGKIWAEESYRILSESNEAISRAKSSCGSWCKGINLEKRELPSLGDWITL